MISKWEKERDSKVCYFDIDGVLNCYPETWLDFLNLNKDKTGVSARFTDLRQAKATLSYSVYRELKKDYRESGFKESVDVRRDAVSIIDYLKNVKKYSIVIITSRPVHKHPSLFKQTVNWLDKNKIVYDDLIFSQNKHIEVLTRYPHLKFGVEDHSYYANLVASWGYNMFLLKNRYNEGVLHERVTAIKELYDIGTFI